jgi:hypothetical protein
VNDKKVIAKTPLKDPKTEVTQNNSLFCGSNRQERKLDKKKVKG